jgi:mannitol-1-/sugar-/sorbitol-6-phosphatase
MRLIPAGRQIDAVLFDMDGTLIESEDRTDAAVSALLAEYGIDVPSGFDYSSFHGVTWTSSARFLVKHYPSLDGVNVAAALQRHFHQTFITDPPMSIPGAVAAVTQASASLPVAIVTSSNRETLTLVCEQLQIADIINATVCAEDCKESKPSPEPFLLAARRLNVMPAHCLVFEDSAAGVQAGLASGAAVIAVGAESGYTPWVKDFEALPSVFFLPCVGDNHD